MTETFAPYIPCATDFFKMHVDHTTDADAKPELRNAFLDYLDAAFAESEDQATGDRVPLSMEALALLGQTRPETVRLLLKLSRGEATVKDLALDFGFPERDMQRWFRAAVKTLGPIWSALVERDSPVQ